MGEFTKERGALETVESAGGGFLRGENHFKAEVCRSVNHGTAGGAERLEATCVFGAVATGQADDMGDISGTASGDVLESFLINGGGSRIFLSG